MSESVKEPTELEKRLQAEHVTDRIARCQKVADAFMWHVSKHKLESFEAAVVLSGAFKSVQKMLQTDDEKTALQLAFISMIENQYERTAKIQTN